MEQAEHIHLLSRAGFGWQPGHSEMPPPSRASAIRNLLKAPAPQPLATLAHPLSGKRREQVTNLQLLLSILNSRKDLESLNIAWINRMIETTNPLHEKMVLFWHNHFATRSPFAYLAQVQHNTLVAHAMGNFRELLHAIAKDPAMILFLNNQQNVKESPNENFAREVMELFTLGEGHYAEKDIQEAARCFTGWQVNRQGVFEEVPALQDRGQKTVLGTTGNLDGEEVIDLLLDNPQTAYQITDKIWRYFVHPSPTKKDIEPLAKQFYASDYDIKTLLTALFSQDPFYADIYQGCLITSPVELIVRQSRLLGLRWKEDKLLIQLQHALGQVLFFPPNVAGWPGGRHWIDGSTLLTRTNLPFQYWQAYTGMNRKLSRALEFQLHWIDTSQSVEQFVIAMEKQLLRVPIPEADRQTIVARSTNPRQDPHVAALLRLLSLPEAQLI